MLNIFKPRTARGALKRMLKGFDKYDLCKKTYARDSGGNAVYFTQSKATSFCILGMMKRVADPIDNPKVHSLTYGRLIEAATNLNLGSIAEFNDKEETTKEHVKLLIKEALIIDKESNG